MRRQYLLPVAVLVVSLAGCSSMSDRELLRPEDIHVAPTNASPGDVIEVSYPSGHLRPNVLMIHSYDPDGFDGRGRWKHTYHALAGQGDQAPKTVPADDEAPWSVYIAPADADPDLVALPRTIDPGKHSICANPPAAGPWGAVCADVEIVEGSPS